MPRRSAASSIVRTSRIGWLGWLIMVSPAMRWAFGKMSSWFTLCLPSGQWLKQGTGGASAQPACPEALGRWGVWVPSSWVRMWRQVRCRRVVVCTVLAGVGLTELTELTEVRLCRSGGVCFVRWGATDCRDGQIKHINQVQAHVPPKVSAQRLPSGSMFFSTSLRVRSLSSSLTPHGHFRSSPAVIVISHTRIRVHHRHWMRTGA